jgi:hypothetical protein
MIGDCLLGDKRLFPVESGFARIACARSERHVAEDLGVELAQEEILRS